LLSGRRVPHLSGARDNARKNYERRDSIYRLFYDTIKGRDFRSREANVYRCANQRQHISNARQAFPCGGIRGSLERSFGARKFRAPSTPRSDRAELLLGVPGLSQISGQRKMYPRRNWIWSLTGNEWRSCSPLGHCLKFIAAGDAVVLATGG